MPGKGARHGQDDLAIRAHCSAFLKRERKKKRKRGGEREKERGEESGEKSGKDMGIFF